ncbi:uncharacterized protein LOC141678310 isoform X2 [Apium graveolens]|uniref:uncharacterized protein LOC141678310 isoform X2 n=1 Tax=Apium graveolens TaxID=4045 RepID=UPI003D78D0A6
MKSKHFDIWLVVTGGYRYHMTMEGGKAATAARKVMVIADATRESAAALQYTLSHAILDNDSLILLHVLNNQNRKNPFPFFKKPGSSNNQNSSNNSLTSPKKEQNAAGSNSGRHSGNSSVDFSFLEEMKNACKKVQPQIDVTVEVVGMEAKDKATVILSQCTEHGIDLVIIGQRRTLSSAILGWS